jgi:hypothetical protein
VTLSRRSTWFTGTAGNRMTTWEVKATAKDVRDVMNAASVFQIPESAAKLIAALIFTVGDVDYEPGVNPPDDAQIQFVKKSN